MIGDAQVILKLIEIRQYGKRAEALLEGLLQARERAAPYPKEQPPNKLKELNETGQRRRIVFLL